MDRICPLPILGGLSSCVRLNKAGSRSFYPTPVLSLADKRPFGIRFPGLGVALRTL